MNTRFKPLSWALLGSLAAGMAVAQEPPASAPSATVPAAPPATPSAGAAANSPKAPAKSTAQIDAGEPRANASPAAQSEAGEPRATSQAAPAPPATSSPARSHERAANTGRTPTAIGPKSPGAADRLQLGTATVTGDREQPKVMYIVPWKKSDIGDQSGKPMNSLLDEALAPVDRDEFKREVAYFDAVNSDTPQNGARKPDSKQGEK